MSTNTDRRPEDVKEALDILHQGIIYDLCHDIGLDLGREAVATLIRRTGNPGLAGVRELKLFSGETLKISIRLDVT